MAAEIGNKYASKFSIELIEDICNDIANGENIKTACTSHGIDYTTFRNWKREFPDVFNLYINANQDKGDIMDVKIDEIMQELRDGILDASTANVLIQTLKWKAAKYYPKMFGEKVQQEHSGEIKGSQPPIIINYEGKPIDLKT